MTMIHVPRPIKSSMNPNRRASSLLLTQAEQMHTAEKRLPPAYRTDIYVNALRTEREVAAYIREVTEAIHRAHADAARPRLQQKTKRARTFDIAASTEKTAAARPIKRKKKPAVKPDRKSSR